MWAYGSTSNRGPSSSSVGNRNDPHQKLYEVQQKVEDVKGVMHKNIELSLDRGAKLDVMEEKAENLESQSRKFQQKSTAVKRHFCCQNIKMTIMLIVVIAIIALIIGLSIWSKNKN